MGPMYRFGLILGPAIFVLGIVEWLLRLTHYIELIEKAQPWVERFTSPSGIWITIVVGLLIFLSAWKEGRNERRERSPVPPTSPAAYATVSPHIEVKPEIKAIENRIEQHFHLSENMMPNFAKAVAKEVAREMATDSKETEIAEPLNLEAGSVEVVIGAKTETKAFDPDHGFVQFESRSIAIEREDDVDRVKAGDLRISEVIKVQFHYANRGRTPVRDCQTWGSVSIVDPAINPGSRLREIMINAIRDGYGKFKNSGNDLGVGMSAFNFAIGTPLTETEVAALRTGALRVHLMLGGAWRDEKGRVFYWSRAEWTNWPEVSIDRSFWKDA